MQTVVLVMARVGVAATVEAVMEAGVSTAGAMVAVWMEAAAVVVARLEMNKLNTA